MPNNLGQEPDCDFDLSLCSGRDVEPPPMLASKTCAKIWATLDAEKQADAEQTADGRRQTAELPHDLSNSGMFLDSANFAPETMLPQYIEPHAEQSATCNAEFRSAKYEEEDDAEPSQGFLHIGLVASISVGIILAFVLFLVMRYAERSTRSYVTEGMVSEVTRRVGHYEQLYGTQFMAVPIEDTLPYNLAFHSWQEVDWKELQGEMGAGEKKLPLTDSELCLRLLLPSQSEVVNVDSSDNISEHILLLMPGSDVPVRLGFGQDILFREGRIYLRILPGSR